MEMNDDIKGLLKKDGQDEASDGDINLNIVEKENEIKKIISILSQDKNIYEPHNLYKLLKTSVENSTGRPLYSELTKQIYNMQENQISNIMENLSGLISFIKTTKEDKQKDEICTVVFKIYDHVQLARFQETEIKQAVEDAKANIREMFDSREKKFNDKVESEKDKAIVEITKKMSDESRTSQRGYVATLGIFAAIILAAFSSLSIAKNIFTDSYGNLQGAILLSTILGTLVLGLIQLLLNAIFKMENKEYGFMNIAISVLVLWIAAIVAYCFSQ